MEAALGVRHNCRGEIKGKRAVVRYADDFVVLCETQQDAVAAHALLQSWLAVRGLTLSPDKTRIVHVRQGFDFLGATVRHYAAPLTSRCGWKLLITPSRASILTLRSKLKAIWQKLSGQPPRLLLAQLNPLIRGWATYFRAWVSSEVFGTLDRWMRTRQWRYVKRRHPNQSNAWCWRAYWGKFNRERQDYGVFGDHSSGMYLLQFSWFTIQRHVLVKGTASRDDPALKDYWHKRQKRHSQALKPSRQHMAKQQNGNCPVCGQSLFNGEELQVHHIQPKAQGGKDTYHNLVLLHLFCHQQMHYQSHR